jgi:hypothetical protein
MNTFLPPIEKPEGLVKKLAYYFTRKQFGKVLTPVKVHSARLPAAFGLFYAKTGTLDKRLMLPRELVLLIREQVARLNICHFCMDIGRSFAIKRDDERSETRRARSLPHKQALQRRRTCCSRLRHGANKRKESSPGDV